MIYNYKLGKDSYVIFYKILSCDTKLLVNYVIKNIKLLALFAGSLQYHLQ